MARRCSTYSCTLSVNRMAARSSCRRDPDGGWTASTIDSCGDEGRFAAIAATPDGMVHVVYLENGADDLRHLRLCP